MKSFHRLPRRGHAAFATALLALIAGGCGDDAPTDPGASAAAAVSGRVALVKTAAGVPNAVVALLSEGRPALVAATDADGGFRFDRVPGGRYTARLTALELTGLDLRFVSFAPLEQEVVVAGEPVDLVFAGNGLVAPRVVGDVSCAGAPVADLPVRVVGGPSDETVRTNAQGRFSATSLSPGHYAVLLDASSAPCRFTTTTAVVRLLAGQEATAHFPGS